MTYKAPYSGEPPQGRVWLLVNSALFIPDLNCVIAWDCLTACSHLSSDRPDFYPDALVAAHFVWKSSLLFPLTRQRSDDKNCSPRCPCPLFPSPSSRHTVVARCNLCFYLLFTEYNWTLTKINAYYLFHKENISAYQLHIIFYFINSKRYMYDNIILILATKEISYH